MTSSKSLFLIVALIISLVESNSLDREMTIEVRAGREECFYETVQAEEILEVDYQVVDGGQQNEMEIHFKISDPQGVPLVADFRKGDNTHRQTVKSSGDYKICFDNTFSRFNHKLVYFEVLVENEEQIDEFGGYFDHEEEEGVNSETYDVKTEDLEEAIRSIRDKMTRSRHFQDQIRNHEFRDRSIAERNYERINFWSVLQILIMLVAGAIQVVLLKSLFDEKSTFHALWRKLC